jgi:hypothetical protein
MRAVEAEANIRSCKGADDPIAANADVIRAAPASSPNTAVNVKTSATPSTAAMINQMIHPATGGPF